MLSVTRLCDLAVIILLSNIASAQQVIREHLGITPNARFGTRLTSIGDADGDAVADYAILTDSEPGNIPPEIAVFSGRDGHLLWRYTHIGVGEFGTSISPAGDLSGDGLADLWIGVPQRYSAEPSVLQLRRGRDGFLIRSNSTGPNDTTGFAYRVAGLGDVNGDQQPDYAVLSSRPGVIEVRSGPTAQLIWSMTAPGQIAPERNSLENAGDCNGDGVDDVIYGNTYFSAGGTGSRDGQIRIYSGVNGSLIRAMNAPITGTGMGFGYSTCSLGDLDGDGRSEVAIGAPTDRHPTTATQTGSALVYSPHRNLVLYTLYPPSGDNAGFGYALNRVGDLDEDGLQDLAVGAQYELPGGVVRVFSGASGRRILEVLGTATEQLGTAIAPTGDLNGDGRTEWLIGADNTERTAPSQGRAFVMSGTLYATAEPTGRGCSFGGAPEPRIYVANRPALGSTIQLWNGANSPAVILLGQETITPYRIQLTECYLQIDPGSIAVIGLLPANSAWPIGVPQETGIIGRSIVFQGFVPEPFGSFLGFVVTNGVVVRFGW